MAFDHCAAFGWRRSFLAFGVILATASLPATAEMPSPGRWPDAEYRWFYNPLHAPVWLRPDAARQLMIEASKQWEACGVLMTYLGDTELPPDSIDRTNVVGWSLDLPRSQRGVTRGTSRAGLLLERDIAFSAGRDEFHRSPTLLKKVLTHEFGHAIGLTHSARCDDIMTLAADCPRADPDLLPTAPTTNDLDRCRALYGLP